MAYKVTIKPSENSFTAEEGETILAAAMRAGYTLPYGCKNGACAACKGKVLEGNIDHGSPQISALADFEKNDGLTLFCQATPKSDLIIEGREIESNATIEVRRLPSRVQEIRRVTDDVVILKLKLPANQEFTFLAGQYIDVLLREGKRRSYSMGNSPHNNEYIELHVRSMANGTFTKQVFETLKEKDILRFEGPLGTFFLREETDKPIILVASGTGFAPIKSIIEYAFEKGIDRSMVLYWGGRRPKDIYMTDLAMQWQQDHPNFSFVPVISDQDSDDIWDGRTGLVHAAVMDDIPNMSEHEVYACGVPVMVEAAHKEFTELRGLPEDAFFSDAFTPSIDPKK